MKNKLVHSVQIYASNSQTEVLFYIEQLSCVVWVQTAVVGLEQACASQQQYREGLQDSERWILQASYRLMAHNTLNVTSPELTRQHIDKHQVGIHMDIWCILC